MTPKETHLQVLNDILDVINRSAFAGEEARRVARCIVFIEDLITQVKEADGE